MSPRELAWRLGAPAAARLRERRRHALPDWSHEPWLASLRELVGTRGDAFAADAARVAAGELELWGRPVASRPGSIDWDANPLSGRGWSEHGPRSGLDAKPIWELHRQQHLLPLAAGAVAAGRPEWGSLCIEDVAAWIAANPRDTGAPGWSSAYETSHRLVGWGVAIPLVSTVCDVPSSLATAYGEQARFVAARTSRYSSANNHRIVELTGSSAGALLTHDRAELVRLADELSQAARNQTFSDGGSREQAAGYFLYVLETLWFAGLVLRAGNVDLSRLREVVLRMLDWLDAVADAAGEPPPVGDDAEDRILRVEYYEPRRAASLASRARELFSEASGPSRGRRAPASRLLADSGYAVFREPARTRIVFDVGDLGFGRLAAHGHADALAVLVDIAGVPMAWDSGTYTYAAADGRD
ncbi:MAG: hypothetical protein QOI67_966, partial [Gaiellaceae bacterium]|nr:hypothetical protein [Gaiellaceae bacterium]